MNTRESADLADVPMLNQDTLGVVASFLDTDHLRRSFIRVSKFWFAIGMDIVRGNSSVGLSMCSISFLVVPDTLQSGRCLIVCAL